MKRKVFREWGFDGWLQVDFIGFGIGWIHVVDWMWATPNAIRERNHQAGWEAR